jgi:hypothetical protein
MAEIMVISDGGTEYVDRDSLPRGDLAVLDAYLDAVEYFLDPTDHPGRHSEYTVSDFDGQVIGGLPLETRQDVLLAMANNHELDEVGEKHSL